MKSANSPPWLRRGGRDLKKNIAKHSLWERTGWFVQTTDNRWLEPTTLDAARYRACASRPSARVNVASRNLLDRAEFPSLSKEGNLLSSATFRVEQQALRRSITAQPTHLLAS